MERHFSQKISRAIALLCYAAAVACAVGAFLYGNDTPDDPVRASLFASVVFFASCGIVLQVIANTRLKGILSHGDESPPGGTPD